MTAHEPVATGDRRGDVHYEPDPDQLVRARFLSKPTDPLPADMATARVEAGLRAEIGPPVEDVAVAPDTPSAWDARPLGPGRGDARRPLATSNSADPREGGDQRGY